MGNSRNLRRASSEDEEEGDIFDDKSEISSGSDDEDTPRREEAAAGSSAPAEDTHVGPSSGPPAGAATTGEGGDSSGNTSGADVSKEPRGTENEQNREIMREKSARTRRGGQPRGDGNRTKLKSTWQLMQEDPSFVPRESRYFLHDDRREGGSEEEEAEGEDDQPDTSAPRSTQTRVGPVKKLWTPDENMGVWKHDMWEQLQKEEAESRTTVYNWNKGRQSRRGACSSYRSGDRGENWVPRGYRGSRHGSNNGFSGDSWRGGWRPRGRGRRLNWDVEPRRQYVPRRSVAE